MSNAPEQRLYAGIFARSDLVVLSLAVLLTAAASLLQLPVKTVADLGRLPEALPVFTWPTVPLSWETLRIIVGPAVAIAMVGLLESLMTATVVDDLGKATPWGPGPQRSFSV